MFHTNLLKKHVECLFSPPHYTSTCCTRTRDTFNRIVHDGCVWYNSFQCTSIDIFSPISGQIASWRSVWMHYPQWSTCSSTCLWWCQWTPICTLRSASHFGIEHISPPARPSCSSFYSRSWPSPITRYGLYSRPAITFATTRARCSRR